MIYNKYDTQDTKYRKEYYLPEPEFIEMTGTFRVNLYRKPMPAISRETIAENNIIYDNGSSVKFGENSVKFGENPPNETKKKILELIEKNYSISASAMADQLSLSVRTIEKNIRELREAGLLVRHGAARGGYWEVVKL